MEANSIISEIWNTKQSWLLENGNVILLSKNFPESIAFATSGSSGTPKYIAHHRDGLLHSAQHVNDYLEVTSKSIWGLVLPWWHVGGFGVIVRSIKANCGLQIYQEKWNPHIFSQWLNETKVTHLSLVPTQVYDLVKNGLYAPKLIIAIAVGGGKIDETIGQEARNLGWPILSSYGMTEAGSQIATQPLSSLNKSFSSSPIEILPHWKIRVDDDDRFSIKGKSLYHGEIVNGFYTSRNDNWHETSDHGLLENNKISITRRTDQIVKILGELVNPIAIEDQLVQLGLTINSFAVITRKDARNENQLILIYENLESIHVEKILNTYNQHAQGFERIHKSSHIEKIPRSSLGKILRKEII
jgi:o-succinylbenzoate---CoA ligase